MVWDTFTQTLHVETDELLNEHTRYALIVTKRLRDTHGKAIAASDNFRRFRKIVRGEYKQALLEAIKAASRHGFHEREIAAASVFTTQSITSVMEKIRDQIKESTQTGHVPARSGGNARFSTGRTWRALRGGSTPV